MTVSSRDAHCAAAALPFLFVMGRIERVGGEEQSKPPREPTAA